MIRMGRGSRSDQPGSNDFEEPATTTDTYKYSGETQPAARAISESDSMARDIKEGRLSGFVGHGTTLTGETEFHAMLRVDGHLIGTVSSESGTMIVGTNGQVDANIMVAAAMINGSVNGDIVATEKLQLGRTARVMGNIQSPRLIVEEGAIVEGNCSMLKARETQEEEAVSAAAEYETPVTTSYETDVATETDADDDSAAYLTDDEDDTDEDDESVDAAAA